MQVIHLAPVFRRLLVFFLALFVAQSAFGQTTWTGSVSNEWHISTNWSTSAVPTATDDVVIPSLPAKQPVISTTAVAKSIQLMDGGASLTITSAGSLTVNGFNLYNNKNSIYNEGIIQNDGQLHVGTQPTGAEIGIWNLNQFINTGEISVNQVGFIGILCGSSYFAANAMFTNRGLLRVGNLAFTAQDAIQLTFDGRLVNTSTGEIYTDRAWGAGIWNAQGSVQNAGTIRVGSVAALGNGLVSWGPFANTGQIQIDQASAGLANTNSFTNTGQITIGASFSLGDRGVVSTGTSATFVNSGAGNIRIDRTGGIALSNESGSTFTNSATIIIGALGSIGGDGINNAGIFSNTSCASLAVFDNITNPGSFTNTGFFTVSTTQPHSNTGTLINNGVITYPQGNPIPNVTNNALTIPSLTATCAASPALQIGASNSISAGTTWYTDATLTTAGGTYNATTNTFTPTGLSVGNHTLYLVATDLVNTCSQPVGVGVQQTLVAPVSISAISTTLNCVTTSLTLTATSSTTNLLWSTGKTTNTISVSTTGAFSVTATDTNGCTAVSNSLTISQNTAIVGFAVNSVSVCQGQVAHLLASGCTGGTVVWSTGTTGTALNLTAGSSTSTLTATCTIGSCSTSASGSVVIGGLQPPQAQILSLRADESACPVRLLGQGVGTAFVFTGPNGYVFSNVFRNGGTHDVVGLDAKRPGIYTLTAVYTNECGSSAPVSRTVTVSRSCP